MRVDLPDPGAPEIPDADGLAGAGEQLVDELAGCGRWSSRVDSTSVIAARQRPPVARRDRLAERRAPGLVLGGHGSAQDVDR
jgi:hypothetical protein